MNSSGGKLILVSDLEGCLEKTREGVAQSRLMCSPEFFEALKTHLKTPGNKVAFLGDYFDQGNMVADSINGIMDVYASAPERVTIIVGNRDANKFRLVYEMMEGDPQAVGPLQWSVWKGFYADIPKKVGLKERLAHILTTSMGAGSPARIAQGLDEGQAGYLLLKIFSDANAAAYAKATGMGSLKNNKGRNMGINTKYNSFINNARNLYRVAKIVHYDPDFKTLMSHGGGMDTFFFHEPSYYEPIKSASVAEGAYYDKLEKARRMLMEKPSPILTTFDEETYNAPLKAVVAEILGTTMNGALPAPPASPSGDFCLLQGLGLKPDGTKHYVSFIQSCENTGCKGPAAGDSGEIYSPEYATFQDTLVSNGVQVLASGHVPHCAPVPLVYKRSDNGKLLFALNDTSNGYRPASRITGLSTYPLTYVKAGGAAVGVGMLPELVPVDMSADAYGPLYGEWTLESAPVFNTDTKKVDYGTSSLVFPARMGKGPYDPAVIEKTQGGGKRRVSRKAKKSRKASRKGRKTRKY